jgi:hypothetical protein
MDTTTTTGKKDRSGEDKIHMTQFTLVKVRAGAGGFSEDKDEARRIRTETILPALMTDSTVVLDFADVRYSTQSFVHALVGEVLKRFGEPILQRMEFRSCSPQVKSLVQLVVDYSLGGFSTVSPKSINGMMKRPSKHPAARKRQVERKHK